MFTFRLLIKAEPYRGCICLNLTVINLTVINTSRGKILLQRQLTEEETSFLSDSSVYRVKIFCIFTVFV